jgi:hypothetical protein
MPKGGRRPGAGRPRKTALSRISKEPQPADAPLKCKRGRKPGQLWNGIRPKRIARDTIESRIRELVKRNDEESKREACRLAATLLPFEEPKLSAVMAETTTTVRYVARLPQPVEDITEWQKQMKPLLLPSK